MISVTVQRVLSIKEFALDVECLWGRSPGHVLITPPPSCAAGS